GFPPDFIFKLFLWKRWSNASYYSIDLKATYMPKVKIARKSTLVDMTPMSDVAFLLVTFFMLTTKFKPQEPVEVITPSAISTTILPESNVAMATISKDGRVFFG